VSDIRALTSLRSGCLWLCADTEITYKRLYLTVYIIWAERSARGCWPFIRAIFPWRGRFLLAYLAPVQPAVPDVCASAAKLPTNPNQVSPDTFGESADDIPRYPSCIRNLLDTMYDVTYNITWPAERWTQIQEFKILKYIFIHCCHPWLIALPRLPDLVGRSLLLPGPDLCYHLSVVEKQVSRRRRKEHLEWRWYVSSTVPRRLSLDPISVHTRVVVTTYSELSSAHLFTPISPSRRRSPAWLFFKSTRSDAPGCR
jgi:hypothetical protein